MAIIFPHLAIITLPNKHYLFVSGDEDFAFGKCFTLQNAYQHLLMYFLAKSLAFNYELIFMFASVKDAPNF